MSEVGLRALRTNASEVVRRVEAGERVTITVDRRPVAEIVPLRNRTWVAREEAQVLIARNQADAAMGDLLAILREERIMDTES